MSDASNKFDFNKLNTLAVVSLASALSLFGAPAAVITGHVALQQLKSSGEKGRWMALVGVVLGYLGIASAILVTIIGAVLRYRHGHDYECVNLYNYNPMCWGDRHGGPEPMPYPTMMPDVSGK
jgi:uncharacterized membrane protein